MALKIALGTSDFRDLRAPGIYYADKTPFLMEFLDTPDKASLFSRPRRFGKSSLLSMVRAYFERGEEDMAPLFEGLAIWQAGPRYREHFRRYPVIHISFKEGKAATWEGCQQSLAEALGRAAHEHRYLLESGALFPEEERWYTSLIERQPLTAQSASALWRLSDVLHRHHNEKVVILIDEYDTPIMSGFQRGYFDEVCLFFRGLFSAGLKDNEHLFRAVLTGVLRVAKEDMFSGPNNVIAYDLLDQSFASYFGFTEAEVGELMHGIGQEAALPALRDWYNGYLIGGQVMYNPWSVLCFARDPKKGCRPYWVSTGADDVLRGLVLEKPYLVVEELRRLLHGETIRAPVGEAMTLRDLYQREGAIWSLLLHSGYLKPQALHYEEDIATADLCIPNREVRTVYTQSILSWIGSGARSAGVLDPLHAALLSGNTELFAARLGALALRVLSFHDTAGSEPEKVYQAFVLGLLAQLLPRYEVDSNREAGLGRYDVLVLARDRPGPGAVLVARAATPEAVAAALAEALDQIEAQGYAVGLAERGVQPVHCYGVACHGKQVWVRRAGDPQVHGPQRPALATGLAPA